MKVEVLQTVLEQRAVEAGRYIIANNATIRQTANWLGISKTACHNDVTQRLKYVNLKLYDKVQNVLYFNKLEAHNRGGEATKRKYKK